MKSQKISVLVVENEDKSRRKTVGLLEANPQVLQVISAADADDALLKLVQINPDLILLEYPVVGKSGNEMISFFKTRFAEAMLVFVAKTREHAAEAIRHEVFNYILKPVTQKSIRKLFAKILLAKQPGSSLNWIDQILIEAPGKNMFRVQTVKGYVFTDPEEIIYCRADGYYTGFILTGNRKILAKLGLSKVTEMLLPFDFVRIGRSNLINRKYIRKIYRESNSVILMAEGKEYTAKGSRIPIRNLINMETE